MGRVDAETGFTLVELMVVVLILTILAAIAVPVVLAARTRAARGACYSNGRVVEGAWSRYRGAVEATPVTDWPSLMVAVAPSELATEPFCPAGGVYSVNVSTFEVRCTVHGSFHSQ